MSNIGEDLEMSATFKLGTLSILLTAALAIGPSSQVSGQNAVFMDDEFEVLECEFVARDGLLINISRRANQRNTELQPRHFKQFLDPKGKAALGVYIAIPRYQSGQPNLTADPEKSPSGVTPTRYRLKPATCPDIFDTEPPECEIDFIKYNATLLFDREETFSNADRAFELLKIAELVPSSGERSGVRIAKNYIPPLLTISSSDFLMERLRGIRDLLTGRAREFADIRRQRGIRATATSMQEILRLVMLQSLNRYVPVLHHHLELGHIHPEPVYALLRQLIGELSVFSEDIDMLGAFTTDATESVGLPAYDHESLWPCFEAAISRLEKLIREMTYGPETGIRLVHDGTYYRAPLPEDVFQNEKQNEYYLMIESFIRGPELEALLQRTGKISTYEDIPQLRRSLVFGLKVSFLPAPPESLPQRGTKYSYFAIDTRSPQWELIRKARNIAVLCDLNPDETIIKLIVIRKD